MVRNMCIYFYIFHACSDFINDFKQLALFCSLFREPVNFCSLNCIQFFRFVLIVLILPLRIQTYCVCVRIYLFVVVMKT